HHLALAWGEPCDPHPHAAALRLEEPDLAVELDRLVDTVEQHLTVERLLDEVDRARAHGAHRGRHVGVAGDHDYRNRDPAPDELLLQVESAHPRQPDVAHDTARAAGAVLRGQELLAR